MKFEDRNHLAGEANEVVPEQDGSATVEQSKYSASEPKINGLGAPSPSENGATVQGSEPRILDQFVDALRGVGVVGEERAAQLIYLVITSRLLPKPVSAAIKGQSSVGKSFVADSVLRFFPETAYYRLSGMSPKALAYGTEDLRHRVLVLEEAAGLSEGVGAYLMRSLISEGQLRYETVESGPDGLKPRLIEREGPTGLLVTTTALKLDTELETRMLSIPVDDSPVQTRSVMRAMAVGQHERKVDLDPWLALQENLEVADVVVPFAPVLAEMVPPYAVRFRRDFGAILALIRTHALLHQGFRSRDEGGRIIAETDDYDAIHGLVADLIAHEVQASVRKNVRETVEAVKVVMSEHGVPLGRIAEALELHDSTVSRRIQAAIELGYLDNLEVRQGKEAQIVLNKPMPDDEDVLPSPETLEDALKK